MAGVLQGADGGIQGLLDLPWEHWEALIADLARLGWTADDIPHRLDWVTVMAIAKHAGEGSALYRVRSRDAKPAEGPRPVGHYSDWSQDRHIAVMTLDELRYARWYAQAVRLADAKKTIPPAPKPTWRPGVEVESQVSGELKRNADGTTHVGTAMPANQFAAWWAATQEERDNWEEAA